MQKKAECHFLTHQCQGLCHHYSGWQSHLNVNQPKTMHPSKDSLKTFSLRFEILTVVLVVI